MQAELEDFLSKSLADKAARKKMSATNARALNTMRQRVKKHNAGFQKEIEAFREHPVSSSEDEPEGGCRPQHCSTRRDAWHCWRSGLLADVYSCRGCFVLPSVVCKTQKSRLYQQQDSNLRFADPC